MTTTTTNGQVRKTLASQLDRLDSILDGLSDALNGAVATAVEGAVERAVKQAVGEAVRETLQAVLAEVARYVEHYNTVRLHSAIGYVTPLAKLEGRNRAILEERDRKLDLARERRKQ
jgi:transposase InsO family protein